MRYVRCKCGKHTATTSMGVAGLSDTQGREGVSKIYIVAYSAGDYWEGQALAEDGTGLWSYRNDNKFWLRQDMGLTQGSHFVHRIYRKHYPEYMLVDLLDVSDAELESNEGYMQALKLNGE